MNSVDRADRIVDGCAVVVLVLFVLIFVFFGLAIWGVIPIH